jgi:hypothetical protein
MTSRKPLVRLQNTALTLALTTVATTAAYGAQPATIAGPIYCILVRDGQGNTIDTVCVPGLPGAARSAAPIAPF